MTGVFDGAIAPSNRYDGMFIACCCIVIRVNRLLTLRCENCIGEKHNDCQQPGYVEMDNQP